MRNQISKFNYVNNDGIINQLYILVIKVFISIA